MSESEKRIQKLRSIRRKIEVAALNATSGASDGCYTCAGSSSDLLETLRDLDSYLEEEERLSRSKRA